MNKMYEKMANELGFDQTIYKDGQTIPLRDDPVFGMSRNGGFMDDLADVNKYGITYDAKGSRIPALGINTRNKIAAYTEEFKKITTNMLRQMLRLIILI